MGNQMEKFIVGCLTCQKAGRNTSTYVYVDFEKRRYYFTCFNPVCGATEVFNEVGEKIMATDVNEAIESLIDKREKEKEDKKESGSN